MPLFFFFFLSPSHSVKKNVTKGNTYFFLWGQGFAPQWHKKPINFCVSAYLLLVRPSNPQIWDITENTSLQYHPLYTLLDCAANYVVISGILSKIVFITGWKKPKENTIKYRENIPVHNLLTFYIQCIEIKYNIYKIILARNIKPVLFYVVH